MNINRLILKDYRNYKNLDITLSPNLNIFIGKNAQGKSNILESVFVLALTKSYMSVKDCNLIRQGEDFARIKAFFVRNSSENQMEVVVTDSNKKLKINRKEVKKYSDYISRVKVLIFSPYNVNFVKDGPSVRRKSINVVISQFSSSYVTLLQNYNALLKKRNQFLKSIYCLNDSNRIYLDMINEKFCSLAVDIYLARRDFISKINEILPNIYYEIMGYEHLFLDYNSNISFQGTKEEMIKQLKEKLDSSFEREKFYGSTLLGIHRDDFIFYLNGEELSIYGSQGQIRAAILALKLAEVAIFKEKDGEYPILLLDDIFSELDVEKRNRLVQYILDDVQTIITTTDINLIDDELVNKARVFYVENGKVVLQGKKECKNE